MHPSKLLQQIRLRYQEDRINFYSGLTLFLTILSALYLRLWNLPASMMFLGDQGRDALRVARIFLEGDLAAIGPVTSIGNMYLGPFYYYFMTPFLWLTYPSPVGPAYAVALVGVLTVWLVYYWGRELVGKQAALIASFLMAFSSLVVEYNRFSWNPNIAPIFGLLVLWSAYKALKNPWFWALTMGGIAILIQLHYLTLLALGAAGLWWLVQVYFYYKKRDFANLKKLLLATSAGVLIMMISILPIVLFDIKHDGLNWRAFNNLFVKEEAFVRANATFIDKLEKVAYQSELRTLQTLVNIPLTYHVNQAKLFFWFLVLTAFLLFRQHRHRAGPKRRGLLLLAIFLGVSIFGTSIYEHSIFDHYLTFLWPVVFLTWGVVLAYWWRLNTDWWSLRLLSKGLVLAFVVYFLSINSGQYPLADRDLNIYDIKKTASTILDRVEPGEAYNLILLSDSGDLYGQNYRYFLTTSLKPPVPIGSEKEVSTLFIINEDQPLEPIEDMLVYEVRTFPSQEPSQVYRVKSGPIVIVLRIEEVF